MHPPEAPPPASPLQQSLLVALDAALAAAGEWEVADKVLEAIEVLWRRDPANPAVAESYLRIVRRGPVNAAQTIPERPRERAPRGRRESRKSWPIARAGTCASAPRASDLASGPSRVG